MQHNLLSEPLLQIRADGALTSVALPELLARLDAGMDGEPMGLQAHQQHAWHAFLVQLAAIAVVRDGGTLGEPVDAAGWRARLLALTDGQVEPWCLVVEDLDKPAFMQPPVPEGTVEKWGTACCADEIDTLQTAKNHDVKSARMRSSRPESWVYSLVSLQTMEGFSGRDNYGISRMNGGFGSRVGIGLAPALGRAARFRRDVEVLLETRPDLLALDHGFTTKGDHCLLWLIPWDGLSSLTFAELDPFYIEVCRRVRLQGDGHGLMARTTSSKAARIDAKEAKGNTGDPWTPINTEGAALTVSGQGLTYRLLHDVLLGDKWVRPVALAPRRADGIGPEVVARVLVRGQGKTDGYHERHIPVPNKALRVFRDPDQRQQLAARAQQNVTDVTTLRLRVLKPALLALVQGGPERLRLDDDRMERWLQLLEQRADELFFEHLFETVDEDATEARAAWVRRLAEDAESILDQAIGATPIPAARRYRAIAAAERAFHGALRNQFQEIVRGSGANGEETHVRDQAG